MLKKKNFPISASETIWHEWFIPLCIFVIVAVVYAFPVLKALFSGLWGWDDWDQFMYFYTVPWVTIREYHQFPLWNPYGNGGNVLLAHPFSPFLSPFYILILIFGPVPGVKLQIIIHIVIGMMGMYQMSRVLGLNPLASYLPAFLYMLNANFAFRMNEGQIEWVALAFLPWLILYFEKSLEDRRYLVGGILSLALIFLAGTVTPFIVSITIFGLYVVFRTLQKRSLIPISKAIIIVAGMALITAIRLLPVMEFSLRTPRPTSIDPMSERLLPLMFLERNQVDMLVNEPLNAFWGWHEYGAYVGVFPFILAGIGIVLYRKRYFPWILMGLICFWIILSDRFQPSLWQLLHTLPFYSSMRVPSRYTIGFVMFIAIFAGLALSWLERRQSEHTNSGTRRLINILILIILASVLLDLLVVNGPIFFDTYSRIPVFLEKKSQFRQRYDELIEVNEEVNKYTTFMMPVALSNSGIVDSYEVLGIPIGNVKLKDDRDYRGEHFLAYKNGDVELVRFSPNKIVLDVHTQSWDTLVLNQNYYNGWWVLTDSERSPALSYKGLVASYVPPGQHRITFYYLPRSFLVGAAISTVFVLILSLLFARSIIKRTTQ